MATTDLMLTENTCSIRKGLYVQMLLNTAMSALSVTANMIMFEIAELIVR